MLAWFKYTIWTLLGILLTLEAVRYEFERRGSLEFGGEYFFLLLPIIVYFIKAIWRDSKEMMSETLSEGWIER
ncbi:hypothetical protein ACFP65_08375 [Marinilactibacillus sp. GCM10026970]|uniref:hypothetical protein n=1 Tax=Marinilactibacillus sp. GCM10026970 TaxID=3252642 RepID=UPI003616DB98